MPNEFNVQMLTAKLSELAQAAESTFQKARTHAEEAAALKRELLDRTDNESIQLMERLRNIARAAQDFELEQFAAELASVMQDMDQVVQEHAPATAAHLSTPREILGKVNNAFTTHIAPMLQQAQAAAHDPKQATSVGNLLNVAQQTFNCCAQMVNYHSKMNTEEKMYAVMGTVLMVAGIGCLVAAACNPVTGPALAAIAIAGFTLHALGLKLAKNSIARHIDAEPEAAQIATNLDHLEADTKTLKEQFDTRPPKVPVSFAQAGPQSGPGAGPQPQREPDLMASFKSAVGNFQP